MDVLDVHRVVAIKISVLVPFLWGNDYIATAFS